MNSQRFRSPSDYNTQGIMEDHPFCTMAEVTTTTKRKQNKNKRRFSDDQIRSLESIFESESRLDPRKKIQVAKDLGLQPRQVAIWFQNKRSRRKSKQLERDYNNLLHNYNNLASLFEGLKTEKQALLSQLQKLKDLRKKPEVEEHCCGQVNSNEGQAVKSECEEQLSFSMERSEHALGALSDDDSAIMTGYLRLEEEPGLVCMVEPADGALTYLEDWHSFESDALFDQSGCGYQWWDFWS
ncbi:Homeobox-leucine zipper protein HOX6 [Hibiscus syriacus]|uniref:Homeobox-leucine zipper protein n=1 Tax=Hibiscus syriacus TaxID=106335 RepID=A0A6A3C249_HIBSY|nr:homeobox-leucine zipper protein ATHB-12-like [Hibiscus syriacus]KAE8722101.1 Homeobox-leucine zipper protein HOX6 [Hibiscus syriacus]